MEIHGAGGNEYREALARNAQVELSTYVTLRKKCVGRKAQRDYITHTRAGEESRTKQKWEKD